MCYVLRMVKRGGGGACLRQVEKRGGGSAFVSSRKRGGRGACLRQVERRGGGSVFVQSKNAVAEACWNPAKGAVAGAPPRPIKNAMVAACLRPIRYTVEVDLMLESGNVAGDCVGGNGELGTHPRCVANAGKKSCEIIEVKAVADLRFPSSKHQLHLVSVYSISRIQTAWHDLDRTPFAGVSGKWERNDGGVVHLVTEINSLEVLKVKNRICAAYIPESQIPNPAQTMDDIRVFILRPNNPSRAFGNFMKWVVREVIRRNLYRLQRPVFWYTWIIIWNDSVFYDNGGSWEREGRFLNVAVAEVGSGRGGSSTSR
ncbi:hypothetical protein BD779DRAFT_1469132 [Infundibulicybe gibba]|nr:hypothetical protein BD779DRAFT_1469132 [Infundibulicybe gibba]